MGSTILITLYIAALAMWFWYKTTYPKAIIKQNDDDIAKQYFIKYLALSKTNLMIFDDRNTNERFDSIYQDVEILAKLKQKLTGNENYKLDIHFNFKNNLLINQLKQDFPKQVSIKYNQNSDNRNDNKIHFKLFDNAHYCYASKHKSRDSIHSFATYEKSFFHAYHLHVEQYQDIFNRQYDFINA